MNRRTALLAAVALCAAGSAHALYEWIDEGIWPKTWPKELEPLRKKARTLEGEVGFRHYEIPFTTREEFEAAWPHLLKVKSKGAPIILVRAPKLEFFTIKPAGVLVHSPAEGTDKRVYPEEPLAGETDVRTRWMWTTYMELAVDGQIVDLNRIALPEGTPIIDERFKEEKKK